MPGTWTVIQATGVYEHVEEDAFAGIFPHYTGTISSVRSQERTGNDGKPFTVYYFKDEGMEFDPCDYEIAGLVKQLSFQSGELNGRDFEANYHSESKEWEIINTYPDEDTQLPGGNLIPHAGDKYIPWNFRMPEAYEKQAEQDYKAAVDDFSRHTAKTPPSTAAIPITPILRSTPSLCGWDSR